MTIVELNLPMSGGCTIIRGMLNWYSPIASVVVQAAGGGEYVVGVDLQKRICLNAPTDYPIVIDNVQLLVAIQKMNNTRIDGVLKG